MRIDGDRRRNGPGAALLLLFCLFVLAELTLLEPVLSAPFLSDDVGVIEKNRHVHGLSWDGVRAILDPLGEPAQNTANWAPVHLLAHALEWELWGPRVQGYHVVNAVLHAAVAVLLAALLRRRGLPLLVAAAMGAVFLLHPATVEPAAWIFQLKTLLSTGLAIAALLAHPSRPLFALALFALALLTKVTALFALPVAACFAWLGSPDGAERMRARWLGGWVAVAAAVAIPAFAVYQRTAAGEPLHPDAWVHLRTIAAIGAQYLAMAASGIGVAPFHEPAPAESWGDPRWIAGALAALLLGMRALASLRARREEAAWWLWAAAAWLPISQLFSFGYPMADRYLYAILPGLLGGVVFALRDAFTGSLARRFTLLLRGRLAPAHLACGLLALLGAVFALQSAAQARAWRSSVTVAFATAERYPEGRAAHLMRARQAALQGDPAVAARELRGAVARGYDRFMDIQADGDFSPVVRAPEMQAVLREMAAQWLATTADRERPTRDDHFWRARAHMTREELPQAAAELEAALALAGGSDERIRSELVAVRQFMAEARLRKAP